jgi:hypothetical protein
LDRSHRAGPRGAAALALLMLLSMPAAAIAADPSTTTTSTVQSSSGQTGIDASAGTDLTTGTDPSTGTDLTPDGDPTTGTDASAGIALASIVSTVPPKPSLPHWSAWTRAGSRSAWIRGLWERLRLGMSITGRASWYPSTRGYWGIPAVALPGSWYRPRGTADQRVEVCVAGRCATVPVVDYCDCYIGTDYARVADMSWALVQQLGLASRRGLYTVSMRLVE